MGYVQNIYVADGDSSCISSSSVSRRLESCFVDMFFLFLKRGRGRGRLIGLLAFCFFFFFFPYSRLRLHQVRLRHSPNLSALSERPRPRTSRHRAPLASRPHQAHQRYLLGPQHHLHLHLHLPRRECHGFLMWCRWKRHLVVENQARILR